MGVTSGNHTMTAVAYGQPMAMVFVYEESPEVTVRTYYSMKGTRQGGRTYNLYPVKSGYSNVTIDGIQRFNSKDETSKIFGDSLSYSSVGTRMSEDELNKYVTSAGTSCLDLDAYADLHSYNVIIKVFEPDWASVWKVSYFDAEDGVRARHLLQGCLIHTQIEKDILTYEIFSWWLCKWETVRYN